jgi:hypothetical protein
MSKIVDYEADFCTWALHNAQLLREGRWSEIDVRHLAAELEDMGNNKQELTSRFIVLIGYLLKWEYQPDHRSNSWRGSINEQRVQINSLVRKRPGLKPYLPIAIAEAYLDAVELASDDTGLPQTIFPEICPYSQEQLLAKSFYPEN